MTGLTGKTSKGRAGKKDEGPQGWERRRRQDLPPGSSKASQRVSLCAATVPSFFSK